MPHPVADTVRERVEASRQLALHELSELKKSLSVLEKYLSGKRKSPGADLFDVVHGAFELFRACSAMTEGEKLLEDMQEALARTEAVGFLESSGARLLTKPAGWHWITPGGEMRLLTEAPDPVPAAEKLKGMLARSKAARQASRTARSATDRQPADEAPGMASQEQPGASEAEGPEAES